MAILLDGFTNEKAQQDFEEAEDQLREDQGIKKTEFIENNEEENEEKK